VTWGAVGGAAVSVIGGSLLGGGSKSAERAAKDSAARAQFAQEQARRQSMEALAPYMDTGRNASRKLAEMLGVADPEGYAKRPELQDFEDELRRQHFDKYGKDYGRNSNVANQTVVAKKMYQDAMDRWEAGRAEYEKANPVDASKATLLKNFTNEDFVKDPGYEFRQMEGEKGIQRQLAKMGGFNSGSALKAIDRYNQDYASNEFSNAYNRDAANKARTFSFLSGSAGQGLQAASGSVGANQNAANNNSQIQSNLGNNLAGMYQQNADNQSNMFQNAIGNGLYIWERNNRPVTGTNSAPSGGYSTETPTFASNAYSTAAATPFWKR
jgi:hypothetical protein